MFKPHAAMGLASPFAESMATRLYMTSTSWFSRMARWASKSIASAAMNMLLAASGWGEGRTSERSTASAP